MAAAYAALLSLKQIIDEIEHHHSPPISLHEKQVESLAGTLTFLQEFLEGYDSLAADGDEPDPLEIRVADSAHAVEDVIESHIVENIHRNRSTETKISRAFSCFRGSKSKPNHDGEEIRRTGLYVDLQRAMEGMDLVKSAAAAAAAEVRDHRRRNEGSSSVAALRSSEIVCSDEALLTAVMEKLVGMRPDRRVISIVGMGGIGKTTLATTVYTKPLIKEHKEHFDVCAWATVSQQHNTREILSELLCHLTKKVTKKEREELSDRSEDKLGLELYKRLSGRRYLVVMDDMWSIDAWNEIQHFFPSNDTGSRVMVTTRLSHLSTQLNSNHSFRLKFLDEASSWELFSKVVFGEKCCPRELEEIGKKIVENCRGLPLSIVVVGGLLRRNEQSRGYWETISSNLTSVVNSENDEHCLRLLRTSYNHLPMYLKPCFLYMGVFEEDAVISVSTLVKLWISESFLKPAEGKSLAKVAEGFLKNLVDRNLILIHKLGSTGNIKQCKIHDLLRDFCLNQGKRDGFYHVVGQCSPGGASRQRRRIVIPKNTSKEKVLDDLQSMTHARSVICEHGKVPQCQNSRMLRMLHAYKLRSYDDKSYASSIGFQLVNLRHLAVEARSMTSFFTSVNRLWNLHTLIVSCTRKSTAPMQIWRTPQFRHIEFVGERSLRMPDPPTDAVVLENLHTLKGVENLKCGDEVIKRIPNIKKLVIKYYGNRGRDHDDYHLSNIKCLSKFESLYVSCDANFRVVASLQNLSFPHSLKKLSLMMQSKEFEWEDDMLEGIGSLPLLEKLKLFCGSFGTGKWEIAEGQFPSLKYLGLFSCRGLRHWAVEESSIIFPSLEQLRLFELRELKAIPLEIGNVPTLQWIWLIGCSEAAVVSAKEIVEEQVQLVGDQLHFRVEVWLEEENQALQSLAGPSFLVLV